MRWYEIYPPRRRAKNAGRPCFRQIGYERKLAARAFSTKLKAFFFWLFGFVKMCTLFSAPLLFSWSSCSLICFCSLLEKGPCDLRLRRSSPDTEETCPYETTNPGSRTQVPPTQPEIQVLIALRGFQLFRAVIRSLSTSFFARRQEITSGGSSFTP